MSEAKPAPEAAQDGPVVLTLKDVAVRGLIVIAVGAAVIVGGVAIYRQQKDQGGLPEAVAPAPQQTVAASVNDVISGTITGTQARLKTQPDDADGWRTLGWSLFQAGDYAKAADALRHATKLDPTNAQTYAFLGEALMLASKSDTRMPRAARAAFAHALRLDPKDARARYFRAVGWDLAGQHRRAINAWFSLLMDTPADAPYAQDIRAVIRTVAARHHIHVEKRLAEAQFAAPGSQPATTARDPAAARAVGSALPGPTGEHMRAAEGLPRDHKESAGPAKP